MCVCLCVCIKRRQGLELVATTVLNACFSHFCCSVPKVFGFEVPAEVPGVPSKVLNPRDAWSDKESYDTTRTKLAGMFKDNFTKFVKVR